MTAHERQRISVQHASDLEYLHHQVVPGLAAQGGWHEALRNPQPTKEQNDLRYHRRLSELLQVITPTVFLLISNPPLF